MYVITHHKEVDEFTQEWRFEGRGFCVKHSKQVEIIRKTAGYDRMVPINVED